MADYRYVGEELNVFSLATNWKRYFSSLLRPYVRGRVLEVGAGIGTTAQALWNPAVESWVCLEPDAQLARRLTGLSLGGDVRQSPAVIVGDISAVPQAQKFDAITYIDVLEHISDDVAELQRAAQLLAPGGALIVLSPAFQFLNSAFDQAIGHLRRYSAGSLAAAFPPSLRRERVFYADSLGMLLSLGNRFLLRQRLPTSAQVGTWDRYVIPASRVIDPLVRRAFGRSVIAVYSNPATTAESDSGGS